MAELDTASPVVTVVDLRGCAHADTFGELALTVGETWALIDAAISAFERRRRRP